jgi:hypothetical protein
MASELWFWLARLEGLEPPTGCLEGTDDAIGMDLDVQTMQCR